MLLYKLVVNVAYIIVRFAFFLKGENMDAIPQEGPVILCPNHKSFWDPVVVTVLLKRAPVFMAKEELFRFAPFGFILRKLNAHPVKRGAVELSSIKTFVKALREGNLIMIFPEGTRVKKGTKAKAYGGAVRIAMMGGAKIVPIGIKGDFKLFKKVTVTAGNPIDLSEYKGQKLADEQVQEMIDGIMSEAYSMAGV